MMEIPEILNPFPTNGSYPRDRAIVTRHLSRAHPDNYIYPARDVRAGEMFTIYRGHTYGVIDSPEAVALTESDDPEGIPFFEFPRDALSFICEACSKANHDACRGGTWCDCHHRGTK